MIQDEAPTNKHKDFRGGRYARTEEELYEKAIALLEKCKIEPRSSVQEIAELEPLGWHVLPTGPTHRH